MPPVPRPFGVGLIGGRWVTAPGAMYDDMLGSDEIANRSAGGTFLHPRTTFDLTYEQEDMMEEEEEEEEEEMDVRAARSDHYLRSDHAYYGGGIRRSYPVDDHDEDVFIRDCHK